MIAASMIMDNWQKAAVDAHIIPWVKLRVCSRILRAWEQPTNSFALPKNPVIEFRRISRTGTSGVRTSTTVIVSSSFPSSSHQMSLYRLVFSCLFHCFFPVLRFFGVPSANGRHCRRRRRRCCSHHHSKGIRPCEPTGAAGSGVPALRRSCAQAFRRSRPCAPRGAPRPP